MNWRSDRSISVAAEGRNQILNGEVTAGTTRVDDIDLLVSLDSIAGELAPRHERLDERREPVHLAGGRLALIEVAYQADPDAEPVLRFTDEVAAIQLSRPAGANSNLAIAQAVVIADHKMVSQAVLHVSDIPMIPVHSRHRPGVDAAVVNNNILPAPGLDFGAADGALDSRR